MPKKSKWSPEEKVQAVEDYLDGSVSWSQTLLNYNIDASTLHLWTCRFKALGIEGLAQKTTNRHYPIELKMEVVTAYMTGTVSTRELLKKYNISSLSVVDSWIKKYNGHGDFKSSKSGSEIYMTKSRKTGFEERQEIVAYCLSKGTDYRAAMEKYEVSYAQIYSWVKKYRELGVQGLADGRGSKIPEAKMTEVQRLSAEIRMLRAQLEQKEMENDILKKAEELQRRWS